MSAPPVPQHLWLGLRRLAVGDATYLDCFGAGNAAYLASLAPLLALPLVSGLLLFIDGKFVQGAIALVAAACNVLAPPVIAHAFCKAWDREAPWARFATVLNWSRWLLIGQLLLVLMLVGAMDGLAGGALAAVPLLGFAAYAFWLNIFLARTALSLSLGRAIVLTLTIGIGTAAVSLLPGFPEFVAASPGDVSK